MEEIFDENLEVLEEPIEEVQPRQNPFCVISKATYGEHAVHDIQTNSGWGQNPYGEDYAVVPDEMVPAIMETRGFCDIELNEDGDEVISFTAREIPVIEPEEPDAPADPTVWDELDAAYQEGVNGAYDQ